jgi:hypothetical protein
VAYIHATMTALAVVGLVVELIKARPRTASDPAFATQNLPVTPAAEADVRYGLAMSAESAVMSNTAQHGSDCPPR